MLVLTRRKNEGIVINDDIRIIVVEVRGDKVRLGIEAPVDVAVHREEIYDKIQMQNEYLDYVRGTTREPAFGFHVGENSFFSESTP